MDRHICEGMVLQSFVLGVLAVGVVHCMLWCHGPGCSHVCWPGILCQKAQDIMDRHTCAGPSSPSNRQAEATTFNACTTITSAEAHVASRLLHQIGIKIENWQIGL